MPQLHWLLFWICFFLLAAEAGAEAAKYAADLQYKAQQEARAELARQYDINQGNIAPWLQSGKLGLTALTSGLGLGENTGTGPVPYGDFNRTFGTADFQVDPGYQFRLSEGMKALDRTAAAKGGALSGGAVKASQRYASDLASQEYQNAYNRFNADQTNRYNRFASLSGVGQTAANTLGNYGQNYASNVGNILTGTAQNMGDLATQAANARATGYYNSANAWGQGINNIANNVASQILLSQILKGGY